MKNEAPFSRTDLAKQLDQHQIGNRMLFGGNLVRQPAFAQLYKDRPESMRIVGDLENSDQIMNNTLFLGTFPGLTRKMIEHEIDIIKRFKINLTCQTFLLTKLHWKELRY